MNYLSNAILPADIKDNKRRTPVDLARQYKHYEVADFVTNYKPLARGELRMMSVGIHND